MARKFNIGLLPQIVIAIILGIGAGMIFPEWLSRIFTTFNNIFSQFLGFLIPLIIIGLVVPAIAQIGKSAGKLLLATTVIAYIATICAGLTSFIVGESIFPKLITPQALSTIDAVGNDPLPYFTISIPPLINVMTALVLSFLLGLTLPHIKTQSINSCAIEFKEIIIMTINKVIIPLLPLYIFGIFLNMTINGQVAYILNAFFRIIVIIFILHIFIILLQYCIAGIIARRNPFKSIATMLPAYFTALGTQSSAATIPVTLKQTIKMGVRDDIAGFVVPLCATIHMSGSILKIVACALALMLMLDIPYDTGMFINFICLLGITIIAAPGIPGGAIMASLGLLSSVLGFTETQNALMIALYIAMDSFGTACNVIGDGAIALIINRFFKKSVVAQTTANT